MADGRDAASASGTPRAYLWTEIFRCFQLALHPTKLILAAAGILAMSFGWYLLSIIFYYGPPQRESDEYSNQTVAAMYSGRDLSETELQAEGDRFFQRDYSRWTVLNDLAGPGETTEDGKTIPGGRLRTMPWFEYRGPNPYLLLSTLFTGTTAERGQGISDFFSKTAPVLFEPLSKLFLPVIKFIDPDSSPLTRLYLLLCLLWSLAVWAFFGGVITRLAAAQLAGRDSIPLKQALKFVAERYVSYILSPVVPLGIIAVAAIGLAVYGLVALIPVVGDIFLYGLLLPLIFIGGLLMSILLIGLVSYPLMYPTISTEGTDTFDAVSRAYNYLFQAPWHYIWYGIVAVLYGAAVTLLVVFLGSITVYLSKWSISQAPLTEYTNRNPDYLFMYSPTSFGWRELFLKGSPLELKVEDELNAAGRIRTTYTDANPAAAQEYRDNLWLIERLGGGMAAFWLTGVFMLMVGFSYSYFWTASTMIYLLMRHKVDEVELDEMYIESELEDQPYFTPPEPPSAAGTTSLPTVPPTSPAPAATAAAPVETPAPEQPVTPPAEPEPEPEPVPEPDPEPELDEDKPAESANEPEQAVEPEESQDSDDSDEPPAGGSRPTV